MKFNFKENAEPYEGSEDFWYALVHGGYVTPEEWLTDPVQVKAVRDAQKLLEDFEKQCRNEGLLVEW
jgi:hypothetical protein